MVDHFQVVSDEEGCTGIQAPVAQVDVLPIEKVGLVEPPDLCENVAMRRKTGPR
jgi:hypothetical protein